MLLNDKTPRLGCPFDRAPLRVSSHRPVCRKRLIARVATCVLLDHPCMHRVGPWKHAGACVRDRICRCTRFVRSSSARRSFPFHASVGSRKAYATRLVVPVERIHGRCAGATEATVLWSCGVVCPDHVLVQVAPFREHNAAFAALVCADHTLVHSCSVFRNNNGHECPSGMRVVVSITDGDPVSIVSHRGLKGSGGVLAAFIVVFTIFTIAGCTWCVLGRDAQHLFDLIALSSDPCHVGIYLEHPRFYPFNTLVFLDQGKLFVHARFRVCFVSINMVVSWRCVVGHRVAVQPRHGRAGRFNPNTIVAIGYKQLYVCECIIHLSFGVLH